MDIGDSNVIEYYSYSNNGNASAMDGAQTSNEGFSPRYENIIIPVIFSLVVLFGGIGNILVIIVIFKNKDHYRNTTNLFILNLSAADVLFLTFCVPFHAVIYINQTGWPFGEVMCKSVCNRYSFTTPIHPEVTTNFKLI